MSDKHKEMKEIPDVITNQSTGKRYLKGKFLGKGGFARCYELMDMDTKEVHAGKIVSKTLLMKKHQREKMTQEIAIHRSLSHKHIVGFVGFFEDLDNVYILLELCRRRSLMELHKRRRAITEPETRYFVFQVIEACKYLHEKRVIHRDLKLGNLFLNDDMEVKIGDFGLATTLDFDGERKKTLCGTPNYIAPEMLGKKGHSYEVDTWAIGCIMFTLLVGKPPFETQSLKETYIRIKKNEYHVPNRVSTSARHVIARLLSPDPGLRPTVFELLTFDFFTQGYMPTRLPTSCLTMAPKFPSQANLNLHLAPTRKALTDSTNKVGPDGFLSPKEQVRKDILAAPLRPLNSVPENDVLAASKQNNGGNRSPGGTPAVGAQAEMQKSEVEEMPNDYYLSDLYRQLTSLCHSKPGDRQHIQEDEAEDPAGTPVFWISKWVDYSDKYGLGYQLCDNSVGVLFNDSTKLVLDGAGEQIQYIERDNKESYYTMRSGNFPDSLNKKITLLKYFRNYMNEHLLKAGANMAPKEGDELARLPCLRTWFRTRSAIVLHLTNGTLQINFFQDHTKVILCPLMSAATYIDDQKQFRTFRFSLLEKYGCGKELASRLKYARTMVERLLTSSTSSRPGSLSTATKAQSATGAPPMAATGLIPPSVAVRMASAPK